LLIKKICFELLPEHSIALDRRCRAKRGGLTGMISVILWWSILLVEETGVPGENHKPVSSAYHH
jgi:hypothetical protein